MNRIHKEPLIECCRGPVVVVRGGSQHPEGYSSGGSGGALLKRSGGLACLESAIVHHTKVCAALCL